MRENAFNIGKMFRLGEFRVAVRDTLVIFLASTGDGVGVNSWGGAGTERIGRGVINQHTPDNTQGWMRVTCTKAFLYLCSGPGRGDWNAYMNADPERTLGRE